MPESTPVSVRVELGERSYEARVGDGLLRSLGALTSQLLVLPANRVLLVCDEGVPAALRDEATASLAAAGVRFDLLTMPASETEKTLDAVQTLLERASTLRLERQEPFIALGGGVIGDITGFAAGIYRRGVPWINCPTTLLAMVDASVGGKTGANVRSGSTLLKNAAGVFHQPRLVVLDRAALRSLSMRQLSAGAAECIKHAMLSLSAPKPDPALMDSTKEWLTRGELAMPPIELMARQIALKAGVVERDEREVAPDADGGRAILNLGHTFAHAVETLAEVSLEAGGGARPGPLMHGEAVGLGLIAAASTARAMRLVDESVVEETRGLVRAAGLPERVHGLPPDETLLDRMRHDKKTAGGRLRLILPVGRGRVTVHSDVASTAVNAGWKTIRAT